MARGSFAFLICAAIFGSTQHARAQDSSAPSAALLDLDYVVPDGCPSAVDFEAEVRAVLRSASAQSTGVSIRIRVSREDDDYVLQMRLPTGSRRLVGTSCEDVTDAAALVVALLLEDPVFRAENAPPTVARPVAEGSATPSRRSRMTWVLDGGGGIDVGTLPVEAPLAYVAFGSVFRTVGWSVRVEYASLPSRDLDEVRSLRVSILRAGLDGCVLPLEGNHLSFGACAGLYGGPLFAAGEGIGEPSRGSTFVLQAQLGPRAWWRLGRTFGLVHELDYVAPLVRPAVVFVGPDRPQDVHRVGAGLAASMGLRLAL